MKLSKHKLSTPDLELLITNLKAFIVKVEEDKENQEYDMGSGYYCVYAKTLNTTWHTDEVAQMLLGKAFDDCLKYKLAVKVYRLFGCTLFDKKGYDYCHLTKQQWLEVANRIVLKLEKKLWKRKVKEGVEVCYSYDDTKPLKPRVTINK